MAEARNNKEREAKKERAAPPIPLPGAESKKSKLEDMTQMDKNFAKMVSHLQVRLIGAQIYCLLHFTELSKLIGTPSSYRYRTEELSHVKFGTVSCAPVKVNG